MVLDTLPHPTQRSITTFRTLLRITILAIRCILNAISLSFAAELFLFAKGLCKTIMGERMTTDLVNRALMAAVGAKRPRPELLHHSDRGSQYCAHDYQARLKPFGRRASMSRRGNCYDNAPMESFWGTLKNELSIIDAMKPVNRLNARSPSILTSSTTASDGIPRLGISRPRRLPNSGPVNSRRHEAVTHGIHY